VHTEHEKHDGSLEHIQKFICAQEICSNCEAVDDLIVDLNSVVNLHMCIGQNSLNVNLLIISDSLDHSRIRCMSYHITLVHT